MRIAVSGSHSVGKSVLVERLDLPGHSKIEEVARGIILNWGELPHEMTPERFLEFEQAILDKQLAAETVGDFIADRSLYDSLAYVQDLTDQAFVKQIEAMYLDRIKPYDLIFYVPIEFGLVRDGVRKDSEVYQQQIDQRLLALYQRLSVPYIKVSGSIDDRLAQMEQAIQAKQALA